MSTHNPQQSTVSAERISAKGFAAFSPTEPLKFFEFTRRKPAPSEVLIDIHYCGVCHSDIHQVRNEWGGSQFPMVPGHEIVGVVKEVGAKVTKYKIGDKVGVGCMVDSCRHCRPCQESLEQYCENGFVGTYNSMDPKHRELTQGGYSNVIVVHEDFVLRIPENLDLAGAAPLLCAGITTYSPLKHWGVGPNSRVAVVGLGGLGHMAVKLAAAMGAHVTVISTSATKKAEAERLGAKDFLISKDESIFRDHAGKFDLVLNTVSADINLNNYLNLLRLDGTLVLVGLPDRPAMVSGFPLIGKRRRLAGSLIGGIAETQEMLNFCGDHGIVSDIELTPIQKINEAYERVLKSDVRFRFVIDLKSL